MNTDVGFKPQIIGNEWKPRSTEVAVRLYDHHVSSSSFIVPPTQTGTLLVDGKVQGRTVGKQDLKTFWQRYLPFLNKSTQTQIFLARNGLISLSAIVANGRSADGHAFHVLCNYQVEIENFDTFWHHSFQYKDVVTTNDIEEVLRGAIAEAANEFLRGASSSDLLPGSAELLQRFVYEIENRLRPEAKKYGLAIVHVMAPVYSSQSVTDLVEKKKRREAELEDSQESLAYQERKHEINKDAYELECDIRELAFDKSTDSADYDARLEARLNEIKAKKAVQRLQVQQGIDLAVQEYQEKRRLAKEKNEDAELKRTTKLEEDAKLRQHLLMIAEIARVTELDELRHKYELLRLTNQGVITQQQLKQRQDAYKEESVLMRKMLEDSLENKKLKENAENQSILSRHDVEMKIREDREFLEIKIREARERSALVTVGDKDKLELSKIDQLARIQSQRLRAMHEIDQERSLQQTEREYRLRQLELQHRPKDENELKYSASPETLRALAELEAAKLGHSTKHAAEKEEMFKKIIELLQQAGSQNAGQVAALLPVLEKFFDRERDTSHTALQAMKEVALEVSKNRGNQGTGSSIPQPATAASQAEILEYFKALLMAQAQGAKA
jgi:hypothetical protein